MARMMWVMTNHCSRKDSSMSVRHELEADEHTHFIRLLSEPSKGKEAEKDQSNTGSQAPYDIGVVKELSVTS
jgi:ATP adenylyltransferase/5',5'''-P-1,P-4-tetraphosphate phosphorylase II